MNIPGPAGRTTRLARAIIVRTAHADRTTGVFTLRSTEPLGAHARCIGDWLEQWATTTPTAMAFAERDAAGQWQQLSWRTTRDAVGRIAQRLLDLDLPADRPIVIVSDNSIDHLLLSLAAMHVGRTACAVSSAYSRLARDYSKFHAILRALNPALIYARDVATYGPALAGIDTDARIVFTTHAAQFPGAMSFADLAAADETPAVMRAFAAIRPDDHAKYLLTSGSTGAPKVVINTHRMLCANQQMVAQVWPFLDDEKPVLVDWLPWSHTFGGNHNLHLVMRNGGTLYIDEGRPAPGLIDRSIRNLRDVAPTIYLNVPRGFEMILPALEADDQLAREILGRMRALVYAGAALPPALWVRMQRVAQRALGRPVWLTTSWGSTETSPAITSAHWWLEQAGVIGAPLPGLELKFVPSGDKLEMRVKGVSVFPGYRNAPELSAQAFDDEGFYRMGDAGYLADPAAPERGVVFDGRVAEDFKLSTGTWVSVGTLRIAIVSALAPLAQDVVITGHTRSELGVMIFPTAQAAALAPLALAERVRALLADLRRAGGGSSQFPAGSLILSEPPNAEAGEITDKGYINQAAVLKRRSADVDRLYEGTSAIIVGK